MACCLPTCARGFSFSGSEVVEKGSFFFVFLASLWFLVQLGSASFASHPPCVYKVWVSKMCLQLDTPCGRWSVGALSLLPLGSLLGSTENCQSKLLCFWFCYLELKMLALVGLPSLHSYDACMVYRVQGASRRNCRQKHGKTSFSPQKVFLFSRNPLKRFWGLVFWYLWIGKAKHPGPGSSHQLAVEVFNVGGWLTHGDLALDAGLDFLVVTEHRLIPARVRSEWARLRGKGVVASVWAPTSQDSSHVGNAGVGVVSLRGAPYPCLPLLLSSSRGSLIVGGPLGAGRFMHLVVLYRYQGADSDPEQLALTDQLFGAALGESSAVARGQPCMLVGDFNVEPTKIPCLAKEISAGLWVDFEASWALATGKQPSSTCMREWGSSGGTRRDFMVGCPLSAAAVLSCVQAGWSCCVTQPVRFSPLAWFLVACC